MTCRCDENTVASVAVDDSRPLILDLNERTVPGQLVNALAERGITCTWDQARVALELVAHGQKEPQNIGAVVKDAEGNSFTRVVFGGTCPWVIGSEYVSLEEGEAAGWPWSRIESPTVISWGVDL